MDGGTHYHTYKHIFIHEIPERMYDLIAFYLGIKGTTLGGNF